VIELFEEPGLVPEFWV